MKKPRLIFVNSMSDLFHEQVPVSFIHRVFDTMTLSTAHLSDPHQAKLPAPALGIEAALADKRLDGSDRRKHSPRPARRSSDVPAHVRFLSFEPLLGPIDNLSLDRIHWVIAGGESGPASTADKAALGEVDPRKRPRGGVAFFFKQWGGTFKNRSGRLLDGRTYDELPAC